MSKLTRACTYCGRKAKKKAENLGFQGVCNKHLYIELTKEVENEQIKKH